MKKYQSSVQSTVLNIMASVSSVVFLAFLTLNPTMFHELTSPGIAVNSNFLSNVYAQNIEILNGDDKDYTDSIDNQTSKLVQSYIVQRGESIEAIAAKFAVSVDQIKKINNKIDNDLLAGEKLYISNMRGFVYPVQEDTISLMVFSNMYNVDLEKLMQANDQTNEMIPYERGQAIFVPDMSLEDAYRYSLLIKPEPKPEPIPEKVIVKTITTKSSTPTKISNTISNPKPTATISDINTIGSTSTIVSSRKFGNKGNVAGMAAGHCTYYAAYQANFAFPKLPSGATFRSFGGNANQWLSSAKSAGFTTSTKPSVGAIAVFKQGGRYYPGAGHVGIVEEVDTANKRIKISDMNYSGLWTVTVRWISMNDDMTQTKGGQTLLGFIPSQPLPASVQERFDAAK